MQESHLEAHCLKTPIAEYQLMLKGLKMFDIRHNELNFQVGEGLLFQEYDTEKEQYTGNSFSAVITHILFGNKTFLPLSDNIVFLSFQHLMPEVEGEELSEEKKTVLHIEKVIADLMWIKEGIEVTEAIKAKEALSKLEA